MHRIVSVRWSSFVIALALMTAPSLARAHGIDYPRNVLTVGPSLGYMNKPGAGRGFGYGLDVTLTYLLLWAGAGVRSFENGHSADREVLPYLEAGVWFIVNVGGGYTFETKKAPESIAGPHFFIGAPVPLDLFWDNDHPWYFEPYYRPTFARDGTVHEVGVLLKGAVVVRE